MLAGCTSAGDAGAGGQVGSGSGSGVDANQVATLPSRDGAVTPGSGSDANAATPVDPSNANAVAEPASPGTADKAAQGNVASDGNTVDSRYAYSYVGRFDLRTPSAVRFNWPASKIGIAFTGTSLAVRLRDTGADTFDVQIDGVDYASPADAYGVNAAAALVACKPAAQVPAYDGNNYPGCILAVPSSTSNLRSTTTYPVATDLAPGNHVAWITKRSEFLQGQAGTVTFYGAVLDANATLLPPPAYRSRRLEFVGDSSFSGFGSAQQAPCQYSARNSDGSLAIPGFVAKYLHAEAVNLSSSGQGVYQSYYDYNGDHNLPTLYRQTVALDASVPYDFASDNVAAVVLSAGGDDLWGNAGVGAFNNNNPNVTTDARTNFVAAYVRWLEEIRSKRPTAPIFVTLTYGAFDGDKVLLGGALQEAVSTRNSAGDANVVYYTYFPNDPQRNPKNYQTLGDVTLHENLSLGCTGHPSPAVAKYLGGLLGAFIAQRLGYTDVGY